MKPRPAGPLPLAHLDGIVIGESVRAGARLRLYSGVVLGSTNSRRRGGGRPTLGEDVVVWPKPTVTGPISVDDRAQVGATRWSCATFRPTSSS
jgi:serine acetyltransferase